MGLSLIVGACSSLSPTLTETEMPAQCVLNEAEQPVTKICRVFSLSDWEALGLEALDRTSDQVLNAITRSVKGDEASANFYPTFVKGPSKELPLAIFDKDGWMLDALIRSSANKASCSYVRDTEALLKEYGGDNQGTPEDKKQGNRCGNISIIHSLVRLGVLTEAEAFSGEFLNPDMVSRLDQFQGDEPGMTPDQQRRAYGSFNTADREINCQAIVGGNVSDKGRVKQVAVALKSLMESETPKYDCSLGIHADDQPGGAAGFKHVEHVTGVRLSPSGEYLIDTLDGFQQGESATKIPKAPATNTWGVGSGTLGSDWVQLKDSSSQDNKRRFSEIPPSRIEMRCCQAVDVSGQ